jgi:hypothetical protein
VASIYGGTRMRLMAIDPGVTTGYCFARIPDNFVNNQRMFVWRAEQHVDEVDDVWDRIENFGPRYIVCEDFEFRQGGRAGLNLYPVQVIGVVRLYEVKSLKQVAVYLQKAAQGKGYYSDNILKSEGFYKRGVPHGMDATRHLLHWLTFGAGYQFMQNRGLSDFLITEDNLENS